MKSARIPEQSSARTAGIPVTISWQNGGTETFQLPGTMSTQDLLRLAKADRIYHILDRPLGDQRIFCRTDITACPFRLWRSRQYFELGYCRFELA
jgi:hypothetical protein